MVEVATLASDRQWAPRMSEFNHPQPQLRTDIHSYLPTNAARPHPPVQQPRDNAKPSSVVQKQPLRTAISEWGLPPGVVRAYTDKGVRQLFPWQAAALESGEDGHNLVYCAPTSGGKSLVAEILMIRQMLRSQMPSNRERSHCAHIGGTGKVLFVLPYISIVCEKTEHLTTILKPMKASVRGFFGAEESRAPLSPGGEAVAVCTIEKANVCVNRLAQEGRLGELACIVIDELHMISDPGRGVGLEMMLTKIRHSKAAAGVQIVGMSATMGGLEVLREWLGARLFCTNYRPVPLTEHAVFEGTIYRKILDTLPQSAADDANAVALDLNPGADTCPLQLERKLPPSSDPKRDPDRLIPLISEVTAEGHSVLVFCATRRSCETTAGLIADLLPPAQDPDRLSMLTEARQQVLSEIADAMGAPVAEDLQRAVIAGIAWHHAGLTTEEREGIERGYRNGCLQVLTATSTLAAGVNLPARRVILKSLAQGPGPVERAQYLQMVGRAGRAGQSAVGEAFIIGRGSPGNAKEWNAICTLITEPVPKLESRLLEDASDPEAQHAQQRKDQNQDPSRHLERLLLESVASSTVSSSQDVHDLLWCTFASRQRPWAQLAASARAALRTLQREKRLLESHGEVGALWRATDRGRAVYDSALPLDPGLALYSELQAADGGVATATPLHPLFYALRVVPHGFYICSWPLWHAALESLDTKRKNIALALGVTPQYALTMRSCGRGTEEISEKHSRFAAALVISDVCRGDENLADVAVRWGTPNFIARAGFTRGHLQRLQGDAAKAMAMASMLCESAGWWPLATVLSQHAATVAAGVRPELVPLMAVPGMTAGKARALWKGGITSPLALASMHEEAVAKALASGVVAHMRSKKILGAATATAGGGTKAVQQGQDSSTRVAKAVAGRAAKALIAAAREHLISCAESGQQGEVTVNTAAAIGNGNADQEAALAAVAAQGAVLSFEGTARAAWSRGNSQCIEMRPQTSDEEVIEFLSTWAAQPRWALAVAVTAPAAPLAAADGRNISTPPILQGLAMCWDPDRAYYLDLGDRHRGRKLAGCTLGLTLGVAVGAVMQSIHAEKVLFGLEDILPILYDAGIFLAGRLFDLKPGALLLSPPDDQTPHTQAPTLKSTLNLVSPGALIRVEPIPRAGVTTSCRSALTAWAALEPIRHTLAQRGLLDCFTTVDMTAVEAVARGICEIPPRLRINLSTALLAAINNTAAEAPHGALQNFSRLPCLLDALPCLKFGPCDVRTSAETLAQDLAKGIIHPSSLSGIPVALWCTPQEFNRRPNSAGQERPLLVVGRISGLVGKRLCTALDFSSRATAMGSENGENVAGAGASSAGGHHQHHHHLRDCGMVSVVVPPLPPDLKDPDAPQEMPCAIELNRSTDQVWRLAPDAAAALLPQPQQRSEEKATNAKGNKGHHRSDEDAMNGPEVRHAVLCQVLGWRITNEDHNDHNVLQRDLYDLPSQPHHRWLIIEILNDELVVLADLSKDPELISACTASRPWARTAAMWSVAAGGVATALSGVFISAATAAAVVHSLVYGWSSTRLAQALGPRATRQQATAAVASFLQAFPRVAAWREELIVQWERSHEVKTIAGRAHHIHNTSKGDAKLRGRLGKAAVAAVLRGSTEDVLIAIAATVGGCSELSSPISSGSTGQTSTDVAIGSANRSESKRGLLVMRGGCVVIASVKQGKEEEAGRAVRQALQAVRVGSSQLAVPLVIAMGCGEGILHPGMRRPVNA